MKTEPKPLKASTEDELLDLLSDVDRAIRIAGDAATGMHRLRWAILIELNLRMGR